MNTLTRLCASEHLALPSFAPSSNPRNSSSLQVRMPACSSPAKKRTANTDSVRSQRRAVASLDLYAPQVLPKSDPPPIKTEAVLASVLVCLTITGSIFASNFYHKYQASSVATSRAALAVTAISQDPGLEMPRPLGVGCDLTGAAAARAQPPAGTRHDVSHVFPRIRAAKF